MKKHEPYHHEHNSFAGSIILVLIGVLILLKLFGICCPSRLIVAAVAVVLILKGLQGLLR